METKDLQAALMNSHWPKCDQIAKQLVAMGGEEAEQALIGCLKAKRHHTRSAAIRGLAELGAAESASHIRPFLDDSSYEVRIDAKEAIAKLTGEAVTTSRGE